MSSQQCQHNQLYRLCWPRHPLCKMQVQAGLARVTNPSETPIYICALEKCNRLFPSKDRLMAHRKAAHNTDDDGEIITWNE
ncbi:hypothetical protein BDY19DRAFT_66143 [Irpex rosettiformis]|uniref:Uncharacterized protein n=1 Tax=Irpex rosettiformis TaxID=378272 RepID=A0ACB8ULU4_9APHY|nr:hypothetical protein BDY19DRAFT_66143 [Irpex rosettiformis]